MSVRRVARSPSLSAVPVRRRSLATRRGACQRPSATVAATPAMASGLATMRSWPIIVAARSTASRPAGTWLALVRPRPKSRAVRGSASGARRWRERDEGRVARLREVRGEGHGARRPALEVLEQLAVDGDRLRAVDGVGRLQARAQQRRGGDDLERRAGRVAAVDRAVVGGVGRAVGDGEDVARRGLHGDQRRLRLAVAERVLGRLLDVAVERRAQLDALAGGAAQQRGDRRAAAIADDDPPRRRARQLVLIARLEAPLADVVADADLALGALDLLGGGRPDTAEQRPREAPARRQLRRALHHLHALDRLHALGERRVVGGAQRHAPRRTAWARPGGRRAPARRRRRRGRRPARSPSRRCRLTVARSMPTRITAREETSGRRWRSRIGARAAGSRTVPRRWVGGQARMDDRRAPEHLPMPVAALQRDARAVGPRPDGGHVPAHEHGRPRAVALLGDRGDARVARERRRGRAGWPPARRRRPADRS